MESPADNTPLIVLVGETASGKTALAIQLAKHFNGEIICADSRTVYKGMDIGTAKPTFAERDGVPHHLLDVVEPGQPFSVADFQRLTCQAIQDISARGHVPFLVGGTGLYIDAILYDFDFRPAPDADERARLQTMSISELHAEITARGITMPHNLQNPRHLTRALETNGVTSSNKALRPNTLIMGLSIDREALRDKLTRRVDAMVAAGFVKEVRNLFEKYDPETIALQAPGYKAFREYIEGHCSLDETKASFVRNDWQLAKRQRTWFKRNKSIHWIQPEESVAIVTTFLNK
ncbi:MAG: tRNA (adenosine(37)-N6)-dimethylallyltransferase MiaA [Candidatus Saccharibacteria bacterium]